MRMMPTPIAPEAIEAMVVNMRGSPVWISKIDHC
jgi:hypothetical protein